MNYVRKQTARTGEDKGYDRVNGRNQEENRIFRRRHGKPSAGKRTEAGRTAGDVEYPSSGDCDKAALRLSGGGSRHHQDEYLWSQRAEI